MACTCKICNLNFDNYKLLAIHLRFTHKLLAVEYYNKYEKTDNAYSGLCYNCGKPTKFMGIGVGFQEFCSKNCASTSNILVEKRKKTCLEKYGVENYAQTKECHDKIKQTCLEKYGNESYFQTEEFKQKNKELCLEKFGVEYYAQAKECQDKMKQTCLKKYGNTCYQKTEDYKEKTIKTNLARYGTEYGFQSEIVKNKIKQTCLEKYGNESYFQTEEFKQKNKELCLEKFGVEYYAQAKECQDKMKQTCLEKYGVENYAQTKECRDKMKQTCLEKYNVEYTTQDNNIKLKMRNSLFEKYGQYGISYSYFYDNKLFDSSWELAYYIWLKDNKIEFQYHPKEQLTYIYDNKEHKYCPDFKVNNEFHEIKGNHFFKDHNTNNQMVNPYDHSLDGLFEAKHQCMINNDVKIITNCDIYLNYIDNHYGKDYLYKFSKINIDTIYNNLNKNFPYYSYDKNYLLNDYNNLVNTDKYNSGLKIINYYYTNIFNCNIKKCMSPINAWKDEKIIKKVISNRLQYIGKCSETDIRRGLSVMKIAPKVSVFKPQLAKYLIKTYLNQYNTIFDPFSGFGGRMLGACSLNKLYIGQDINQETIENTLKIIDEYKLNATVERKNIFNSTGEYECLFTCSPYQDKEIWNKSDVNKTCDEWIDECLSRFKCKNYLFVVDDTEKYKSNIVKTITNKSHFNTNYEYVILI